MPRHAVAVLACAVLAVGAAPADAAQRGPLGRLGVAPVAHIDDGTVAVRARPRALLAAAPRTYRTATRERVRLAVSPSYVADPAADRRLVSALDGLVHGPELSRVTVVVATPGEIAGADLCGADALGCYDAAARTLYVPGERLQGGPPVMEIVAHEYGHAIASFRRNPPFPGGAYLWGTKRWATVAHVCRRVRAGLAFPGDEGARYAENPGEAFADAYRVLNGGSVAEWQYDRAFLPDAAALAAVRADVLTPWAPSAPRSVTGVLRPGARARTVTVDTPLDGALAFALRTARGLRAVVSVTGAGGQPLAVHRTRGAGTAVICGDRRVALRVARRAGAGAFALAYLTP